MTLRNMFAPQFARIVRNLQNDGYEVAEPSEVFDQLEDEVSALIAEVLAGRLCADEMADIRDNIIADCHLNRVPSLESRFYAKVDAMLMASK